MPFRARLLLVLLTGCAARVPPQHADSDAEQGGEAIVAPAPTEPTPIEPTAEPIEAPTVAEAGRALDDGDARCFEEEGGYALRTLAREPGLRGTIESPGQEFWENMVRVRAEVGDLVRVMFTVDNAGPERWRFSEEELERISSVQWRGWRTRLRPLGPEPRAGDYLEPGAKLRFCLEHQVPATPLVTRALHEQADRDHAIPLSWPLPGPWEWRGHPINTWEEQDEPFLPTTGLFLVVRYPREARPRWGSRSWGGIIALTLAEGASIETIARETGVRIGTGVPELPRQNLPPGSDPLHVSVQAPPRADPDALAVELAARPDVVDATARHRRPPPEAGQPRGCDPYDPCPRGQRCVMARCPGHCPSYCQ